MLQQVANQKRWGSYRQTLKTTRHRLFLEWLICTLVVLLTAAAFDANSILFRLDNVFYDRLMVAGNNSANHDIVIVAIDDLSLATLGREPFPREHLAEMLDQLAKAKPRAIAIDLPLSTPSVNRAVDDTLALALSHTDLGKVFLSLTMEPLASDERQFSVIPPLDIFTNSVTGLGHVNTITAIDGVTRSMFLHEFENKHAWPSLALQMYSATGGSTNPASYPPSLPLKIDALLEQTAPSSMVFIPFAGTASRFVTVPLIKVLNGSVPATIFTDKFVLIGITARGMGNRLITPHTAHKLEMPSIAVTASILEGMLEQKLIRLLSKSTMMLMDFLLLAGWMLLQFWWGPRTSFLALVLSNIVVLGISSALMFFSNVLFPFSTFWVCSLIGYILWGWRRVTIMFLDLRYRARALKLCSHSSLPDSSTVIPVEDKKYQDWNDVLMALDEGILINELSRQEVFETLRAMPEAVLLVNSYGNIMMANSKAHKLLKATSLVNQFSLPLIMPMPRSTSIEAVWGKFIARVINAHIKGLELKTPQGLYILIRATAIRNFENQLTYKSQDASSAWHILTLVDVSEVRRLQRQRDDMLQLLWHDLRAPQTTILALLHLLDDRDQNKQQQQVDFKTQIASQVETTLDLANDLVWQMRSEDVHYEFHEVDMIQIVHEVVDRAFTLASAKQIKLRVELPSLMQASIDTLNNECHALTGVDGIWLQAEPKLLGRALFNLVENAIKYSPTESTITIQISLKSPEPITNQDEQSWPGRLIEILIKDQSFGISEEDLPNIFEPYVRAPYSDQLGHDDHGHGLGLRLVKAVISAHHGTIRCVSTLGKGSTFAIELPLANE
jgi:signal transduction histidine kinase/CHASE2 domain-containing sensor protein